MGLQPDLIPLGPDGSPDANPEDEQVEDDGGHQPWDVQSHLQTSAARASPTEQVTTVN